MTPSFVLLPLILSALSIPQSAPPARDLRRRAIAVLTVSPDALDFGARAIGTTSEPRTLVLRNTDREPMRITAVDAANDFAASGTCLGSVPLPVNGTCTLDVTFAPTAAGSRPWIVGIETDRTILPDPIRVNGVGVRR